MDRQLQHYTDKLAYEIVDVVDFSTRQASCRGLTPVRDGRMPAKRPTPKKYNHYHKDGTLWATGQMLEGVPTGYWEWFRKDGSKLRSGWFENGQQVGEWTTYGRKGEVYKVTQVKPKAKKRRN
jgi:hypothetical protein